MTGRGTPAGLVLLLLAALARPDEADATFRMIRKEWPGYDRSRKVGALMTLEADPAKGVLAQARTWLRAETDPVVTAQLVRLVVGLGVRNAKARPLAQEIVGQWVVAHLGARSKKEKAEFDAVCREHGRRLPPEHEIAAGRDWKDPYDEERRTLPDAIKAERTLVRGVVAALESVRTDAHYAALLRLFGEHHDPEVLVRVVGAFGKWKEWRALPVMADLVRIQQWGRGVGGSDVIGRRKWDEMRLKWDLHKDRLWWSRPEYVPRLIRPICAAASATTGAKIGSAAELDRWLLAHEHKLRARGVPLTAAFRARAATSQR